jgi:hypothetical protein
MDDEEETTPTATMRKRQWQTSVRKTNHATGYTKARKRFQWHEHDTSENLFHAIHPEKNLMSPLKFIPIGIEKTK